MILRGRVVSIFLHLADHGRYVFAGDAQRDVVVPIGHDVNDQRIDRIVQRDIIEVADHADHPAFLTETPINCFTQCRFRSAPIEALYCGFVNYEGARVVGNAALFKISSGDQCNSEVVDKVLVDGDRSFRSDLVFRCAFGQQCNVADVIVEREFDTEAEITLGIRASSSFTVVAFEFKRYGSSTCMIRFLC